ncbi:MAG TPA: pyridoxamine 5'-phosphate oxidase family protein [Pseudolabrys sp.]|jgi:general stress protein 26|nr:pyridoxamine 5'-phosphate oxidase family protein [Pseudolabrys sp.]
MDHESRVWDILERSSVGMLATRFSRGVRARPLDARPDRATGVIYFVTDVRGLKDDEIEACPEVCFIVVDAPEKAYLSITGRAHVLRAPMLAAKIWKRADDVWWPGGPQDKDVRVLCIEPDIAELWDGPASAAVARQEFARARATGERPNLGENRKVTVQMT